MACIASHSYEHEYSSYFPRNIGDHVDCKRSSCWKESEEKKTIEIS